MRAIEKARAAIREIMGPVIVHPEASAEVIARQQARQEQAADKFARAAVLAFLDGLDDDAIARVARKTCVGKMNIAETLDALRAEAGGSDEVDEPV